MPYFVLDQLAAALNERSKSIKGSKILVLGLAYKRDIDDLRESPSLTIIELLRAKGANVAYNDPYIPTVGRGRHYDLNMTSTPLDNLAQYDAVLIVTDHSSYDYKAIVSQSQLVVDTRNATKGITRRISSAARPILAHNRSTHPMSGITPSAIPIVYLGCHCGRVHRRVDP